MCVFEGRTYFEGQRETVYSSSGDCVLFECKVRILLMEKKKLLCVRYIKVPLKETVEIQTGLPYRVATEKASKGPSVYFVLLSSASNFANKFTLHSCKL